jgi:hypothetical protein
MCLTLSAEPHREAMFACAWDPTGAYLVTAAMDGTLAVTDPRPLRQCLDTRASSAPGVTR